MPGRDGTGPRGQGPMNGGGFGYCAGFLLQGAFVPGRGSGNGGGSRGGWGNRHRYYATGLFGWQRAASKAPAFGYGAWEATPMDPSEEANMLKEQARLLERQLADIQKRLSAREES